MASKLPAVKNSAFVFRAVLFAQSDNQIKSNPTIAAGDFKVSVDGAAFANLTTLPDVDPDSTVQVKISLSADEMNGDEIMVTAIDASGAEWHSAAWVIHTAAQTFDTMDANIDSILTDTGTTLDTLIKDIPTVAEFEARTMPTADYFDAATDAVANVTTVGSVTGAVGSVTGNVGGNVAGSVGSVTGAVASVTGNVGGNVIGSVGSVATGGITAASIATNAIDADALAADAGTELGTAVWATATRTLTASSDPTAAAIADAVWDEALAGHAVAGSAGAGLSAAGAAGDPWATTLPGTYTGEQAGNIIDRIDAQLATSAATVVSVVADGEDLTAYRGDSFSVNFTDIGNVTARTKLWFTAKTQTRLPDSAAKIQIEETGDLLIINGETAVTPANGTLTVTDAATGDLTVTLAAVETAKMPTDKTLVYDIQMLTATGVTTLAAGTLTFTADVTRDTD